jgi:hypothetical protein
MKSQATDDYSPYVDTQSNGYINDINNGVYTNNSLTLVNFDLGQKYNSTKFTDTSDLFCVLPITMVVKRFQSAFGTVQNTDVGNVAGQYRCGKYYDTTNNANGIVGATNTIVTTSNLATEFLPYFEVKSNYMVWYDFAVIKLEHLFE